MSTIERDSGAGAYWKGLGWAGLGGAVVMGQSTVT
jgi:hypothetical protein